MNALSTSARPTRRSSTVLLVDDEPDIVESLRELLLGRRAGTTPVRVLTAASASEALEVLAHESVDLLVTDYWMPRMDGLALIEEIGHRYPGLPCILASAFPDRELLRRAVEEARVARFFSKPFEGERFADEVFRILRADAAAAP